MIYQVIAGGNYQLNLVSGPFGSLGLHPSSQIHAFTEYQVKEFGQDWDTLYWTGIFAAPFLYNRPSGFVAAPGIYVYRSRHIDDLEWESEWSNEVILELQLIIPPVVSTLSDEGCPGNPNYVDEGCVLVGVVDQDCVIAGYEDEECDLVAVAEQECITVNVTDDGCGTPIS